MCFLVALTSCIINNLSNFLCIYIYNKVFIYISYKHKLLSIVFLLLSYSFTNEYTLLGILKDLKLIINIYLIKINTIN